MYKRILFMSLPLILPNICVPLCAVINSSLLGHLPVSDYLSAISLGGSMMVFLSYMFSFLRMSTTGKVAQSLAINAWDSITRWMVQSFILASIITLALIIAHPIIEQSVLAISGIDETVSQLFSDYFSIVIYAIAFILFNYILLGFFIAIQKPLYGMMMAIIIILVTGSCSAFSVLVLHGQVKAIAISTVIGEGSACMIAFVIFLRIIHQQQQSLLQALRSTLSINWNDYRIFFQANSNLLIRSLCILVANQSFFIVSSHLDSATLAANQLLFQFCFTLTLTLDAFANTTESLVGHAKGDRNYNELKVIIKTSAVYFMVITALFVFLYALFHRGILSILTSIQSVHDIAHHYVMYSILFPLITAPAFWLDGIFIGLLDTKNMRNAMLIAFLAYGASMIVLWPYKNNGLWIAIMSFYALRALTLIKPLVSNLTRLRRQDKTNT